MSRDARLSGKRASLRAGATLATLRSPIFLAQRTRSRPKSERVPCDARRWRTRGSKGCSLAARETDLVRQDLRRPNDSRIARLLTLLGLAAAGTAQDASTRVGGFGRATQPR